MDNFSNTVRSILKRWQNRRHQPIESAPEYLRRTLPDATMSLLLRFETESGPRTVVAPRLPLKVASQIASVMIGAGHYAEMIDDYPPLTVAERIKRLKSQHSGTVRQGAVFSLAS